MDFVLVSELLQAVIWMHDGCGPDRVSKHRDMTDALARQLEQHRVTGPILPDLPDELNRRARSDGGPGTGDRRTCRGFSRGTPHLSRSAKGRIADDDDHPASVAAGGAPRQLQFTVARTNYPGSPSAA